MIYTLLTIFIALLAAGMTTYFIATIIFVVMILFKSYLDHIDHLNE